VLVSDSHKLVFVHIQKTGGSTVHRLLQERIPDIRTIAPRHEIAVRGMPKVEAWDEYYKFAFVRNPWDRLVSWYSMVTKFPRRGNELWKYVHDNSSNFREFIYNCTDEVEIKRGIYYSFAYNQLDYVTDENGNMLVDFIGSLENFDADVHEVFSRIGIDLETVPHKNRSRHQHFSTLYTPDTEMIVRERFKRDIEYFGYEFERPDTSPEAGSGAQLSIDSGMEPQRKVEVRTNGIPRGTGPQIRAGRTPKDQPPTRPGMLFVCGCDKSGTTILADYLNLHPEILISRGDSEMTQQGEVVLDPSTFEKTLGFGSEESGDPLPDNNKVRLTEHRAEPPANEAPVRPRWIGASNPDYVRRMETVAANNPGARFIVVYRPIEEVAESWETNGTGDHAGGNGGFEQTARIWSRSLQGTRKFIRESLVPRVLLVSYHDLLYRSETVVPLLSRFLGLEFHEPIRADRIDRVLPTEALGREKRSSIRKYANRAAEAWILDRIDKQWTRPELYTQETSKAALATSLDEMEARTWRLQQKVKELERDRERRRRKVKQLKSSRTWKLVNKISGVRAKLAGK
jgi:chondroitin 4-sulfotransferase 11